jgi:hypothetical protein
MPLRTIAIRFTDPEVPLETASELLSYIAFPLQYEARRQKLATALCRFGHRNEMIRDSIWGRTPQLVRPVIFFDEQYEKEAYKNLVTILKRLTTAVLMLLSDLTSLWLNEPPLKIFESAPNASNIAKNIAKSLGLSEQSESTIRSRVWAQTKPVSHLAFSYFCFALNKRWEQETDLASKRMIDLITPYPDKATLFKILTASETIRPHLSKLRYEFSDDNTIKFVTA